MRMSGAMPVSVLAVIHDTAIQSAPAPLPFAHAGHVLVDLLMVAPVIALILWFAVITIRDRRRGVDEGELTPEKVLADDEKREPR
jgi:hypothetical protein